MSSSGEKEEVKLPWEVAVEAFGRSVPGGRHSASRGGSFSGQHRGDGHTSSKGQVGSTSSPVTGGQAGSAGSEVEVVTRQG